MKKLLLLVALIVTATHSHASTSATGSGLEQFLSSTVATISIECEKISQTANSQDWQNLVTAVNNLVALLSQSNSGTNVETKIIQAIHDIIDIIGDIKALSGSSGIQTSVTASVGTPQAPQTSPTTVIA